MSIPCCDEQNVHYFITSMVRDMEKGREVTVMIGWVLGFSDITFWGTKIEKSISFVVWIVNNAKILTKACVYGWLLAVITVSTHWHVAARAQNSATWLVNPYIYSIMQTIQRSKLGKLPWYDLECKEICGASPDCRWAIIEPRELIWRHFVSLIWC